MRPCSAPGKTRNEGGRRRHSTPTAEASENKRGKRAARLLRSDVDIWGDSAPLPRIAGGKTTEQMTENVLRSQPSAPFPDDSVHLPRDATACVFPSEGKQQSRGKTKVREK